MGADISFVLPLAAPSADTAGKAVKIPTFLGLLPCLQNVSHRRFNSRLPKKTCKRAKGMLNWPTQQMVRVLATIGGYWTQRPEKTYAS